MAKLNFTLFFIIFIMVSYCSSQSFWDENPDLHELFVKQVTKVVKNGKAIFVLDKSPNGDGSDMVYLTKSNGVFNVIP